MWKANRRLRRVAKFIPILMLYQTIGCLPNDAFAQVFAENIVLTSAIAIQTITSLIFNSIFGVV